jgi:hypothetical protein
MRRSQGHACRRDTEARGYVRAATQQRDTRSGRRSSRLTPGQACARTGVTLLIVATALVSTHSLVASGSPAGPEAWRAVVIAEHDTLWDVAVANPVSGLSVGETVALIRAENALVSSTVFPGQVLRVPAAAHREVAYAAR